MNPSASPSPVNCCSPDPRGCPRWRIRLTAGFDRLLQSRLGVGMSLASTAHTPRLALQIASHLGRCRHRLSGLPRWQDIQTILGHIPEPQAKTIARQMSEHWQRNQVLCNLTCLQGVESLYPLLQCEGTIPLLERHRQSQPAILLFPHVGPSFAAMAGLASLNIPILLFNALDDSLRYPVHIETWRHSGSSDASALFLKQAVDRLKRGGFVAIAFDGSAGQTAECVPFMGGTTRFQSGMVALHRLSKAPVIPVSAHWKSRGKIGVTIHPPLSLPATSEGIAGSRGNAILVEAAAWLESCIRTRPDGLSQKALRWLSALNKL